MCWCVTFTPAMTGRQPVLRRRQWRVKPSQSAPSWVRCPPAGPQSLLQGRSTSGVEWAGPTSSEHLGPAEGPAHIDQSSLLLFHMRTRGKTMFVLCVTEEIPTCPRFNPALPYLTTRKHSVIHTVLLSTSNQSSGSDEPSQHFCHLPPVWRNPCSPAPSSTAVSLGFVGSVFSWRGAMITVCYNGAGKQRITRTTISVETRRLFSSPPPPPLPCL